MFGKRSVGEHVFDGFNVLLMIFLSVLTIYPMYYILAASLTDPAEMVAHSGLMLLPIKPTLSSYRLILTYPMIFTGYGNTILYVAVGTFINMMLTILGGYALSRKGVPGSKFIMMGITFTMFFSGGLIPRFLLIQTLGFYDKIWAIVLPGAISTTNMIIMRTTFAGIPDSLEEAAKIDGANDFTVLFKIMLPMALATVSVLTLFYGVGHWNEFFGAMIYLKTREKYPLQLLLREMLISNATEGALTDTNQDKMLVVQVIKYSTIIVSTAPILVAYPFLQRYFTKGVMIGAIKG